MGAFSDSLARVQPSPQDEEPTIGSEASRGFSSGLRSAGANLQQLAGLGGEVVGANDFANARYADAKSLRAQAEQMAPVTNTWDQVHDLRSGAHFVAGQLGAMAPVAGAAVAGGLITRNPFTAGTVAMGLPAAGDIAARQQEDPQASLQSPGTRATKALAGGLAVGGVQSLGPGMFAGKVLGTGAAAARPGFGSLIAKNMAEGIGVNAAGGAAGEAISQYATNQDKPLDYAPIKDAAITGGVVGSAFGAAGAGAEALHSGSGAVRTSINDRLARNKIAAGEEAGAAPANDATAPKTFPSAVDEVGELFRKGTKAASDAVKRVLDGKPEGDDAAMAGASPEQAADMLKGSDEAQTKQSASWGEQMMKSAGITPEQYQRVSDVMGSISEPAGRVAMAGLKQAWDVGQEAVKKASDLRESFKRRDVDVSAKEITTPRIGDGEITDVSPIKKSDDFSGVNKAITDKITPLLESSQPELANKPGAMTDVADSLRQAVTEMPKNQLSSDTMFRLIDTLGGDTASTLSKAYQVAGDTSPAKVESFNKHLNELADLQKRSAKLQDIVGGALTDKAQGLIKSSDLGALTQALVSYARGDMDNPNAGPHQRASRDREFRDMMAEHFGDKADAVSLAVEKEAGIRLKSDGEPITTDNQQTARGEDGGIVTSDKHGAYDEGGNRVEPEAQDTMRFGLSKADAKGNHRSELNGAPMVEGNRYVKQHTEDLKARFPKHDVRFEKIEGSDHGHLVVEKGADPEALSHTDVVGMKLDTKKYAKSLDRIDVGDMALDSRRVAKVMDRRLEYTEGDEQGRAHRLSRMFQEGLARLMEQHGKFEVRDSVVIGRIGGEDFTYGDSKKLRQDTAENRMSKKGVEDLKTLRDNYKGASENERAEILVAVRKLHDREKNKELASGDNNVTDTVPADNRSQLKGGQQGPRLPVQKASELPGSGPGPRAAAMRRLQDDHERHIKNIVANGVPRDEITNVRTDMGKRPFEERNGNFDENGNLTKAGAIDLLQGDYHGGIDVNDRSTHAIDKVNNQESRGEGRTEIGKDEQVHRVASTLGEGEGMLHKSNMDGSGHSVSDRPPSLTEGKNSINDLKMSAHDWSKSDTAAARAIGERASALLKNIQRMSEADQRKFVGVAGGSAAKASEVINALNDKYESGTIAPGVKGESAKFYRNKLGHDANPIKFEEGKKVGSRQEDLDKQLANEIPPDDPIDAPKSIAAKEDNTRASSLLEKAIGKRQEYLDNPPDNYSTEVAKAHLDWAVKQKERVDAEFAKLEANMDDPKFDHDRYDHVTDLRFKLKQLVADTKAHLENEKDMHAADKANGTNLFGNNPDKGSTPGPKALAAKKAALLERAASGDKGLIKELSTSDDAKGLQRAAELLADKAPGSKALEAANERLSQLVQDPDTAYGLQTKKYSLESADAQGDHDGPAKLITRLAADRRALFVRAPKDGVFHSSGGTDTFGPLGREFTHYFANDAGTTHSFVIPNELVPRLSRELAAREGSTARQIDALSFFSAQHAFYDSKAGGLETFGPRPDAPGAKVLDKLGALGDTGRELAGGVPVTRVEGVSGRDTAKFLATALAYSKHVLGKESLDVNWERVSGAKEGKQGGGKFSAQAATGGGQTANLRANVADHITKVLGPSVKLKWENLTHAGEFERMRLHDVIRLSVHALDPMSTAYHESLHAFFAQLKDAKASDISGVLEKTAASDHVMAQLTERFKNEPAVLAQLKDPEERAAYMYQMWAADPSFKVNIAAKGVFGKIAEFIRSALGIWSNDERALHIMQYFNEGKYAQDMKSPSVVRDALMNPGRNATLEAAHSFVKPLASFADAVVGSGSSRLRDTGLPALGELADIIKREHTTEGGDQGYVQASRIAMTKRMGDLGNALSGYSPDQLQSAMEQLQSGIKASSPEARLAARTIQKTLADTKGYMEKAGLELGDLGPDYFPRVWDNHYISKNLPAFRDMLEPYVRRGEFKGSVDSFIQRLGSREGNEFGIEKTEPGMQFTKGRLLSFIKPEDASQFLKKDLFGTMGSYIGQATRLAEWNRRLGDGKLEALKDKAKAEGATAEQMGMVDNYLKGVNGTLGDSLNPHIRRMMGNMIVYQNVRLLPMAAFSMLIDPNGVMVRGGTVKDAWSTFKRGMSELPQTFGKHAKADEATRLAELTGVIDSAILSHTMGDLYTQGMVGGVAKSINNTFFKYNMVEGLNRSFRVGASEAAMNFMARHADGTNSAHSRRFMAELGIEKGDVIATKDGRIALTTADGLNAGQVERVHAAINQWVDGAVLRPDAADKPIWMNDPRFALVSHLKQFVYSFQKTILDRTMHEMKHGNYTPAMALASYVPVMMAADFLKGALVTGGGQPEWQKGWDAADYVGYGMQRAGLAGVGQFGLDIAKDLHRGGSGIGALTGPTIEQFGDAVQMLGGHKQFGPMVLNAMPANALYAHAFGGGNVPDPMFAE